MSNAADEGDHGTSCTNHELERAREHRRIASLIHDAISQDLAVISLIAQSHRDDDAEWDDWNTVAERAKAALSDMRTLIARLDAPGDVADEHDRHVYDRHHRWLRANDSMLHHAGLEGQSALDITPTMSELDKRTVESLRMVLQEVYTNVLKHADPAHPYHIAITVRDDMLDVEYDDVARPGETPEPGGHGLRGMARLVGELGGTIEQGPRGRRWYGHLRVPLGTR
ncbi:MAG: histidine kinase [Bifidobacterium sp.]|nr:histidine kinase [Bifidobacterium sp.]